MAESLILNVDDYVPGRYARTKVLRGIGLPVLEAGTGEEALRLVEQRRPSLVLLDVNLPDISGVEVCRRIRGNPETAGTTIVHISASSVLAEHQVHALDSGADGYIVEPVEPEVLIATVNAYLRARRAEEALRRSNEEQHWFSWRLAHDLNEPLRTIRTYAEMMRLQFNPERDTAHHLDFIIDAAARMRSFIDGILEFSQFATVPAKFVTLSADEVLDRVIANMDGSILATGTRIVREPLPQVRADERIEYVFQNLISNAIKYRSPERQPEVRICAKRENDVWVFAVQDNGMGIEHQYLARIFDLFHRLHGHDIPGNGLGLALCRKIVESHGGMIWAESEPGLGSRFFFTLSASPDFA